MTAKEQAYQIWGQIYALTDYGNDKKDRVMALKCALIAVNEIINELNYIDEDNDSFFVSDDRKQYWHKVKQEITNI